jgi:amino acid adenylation domain-containing protein/non-ribosomal peptide synthase protein (TIGR01720 family)
VPETGIQSPREGFRLSPQQEQLWQQGPADVASAGVWCRVRIRGGSISDTLRSAVPALIAEHEALRTTIQNFPGHDLPLQVVAENAEFTFEHVDLRTHAVGKRESHANSLILETLEQRFHLERGPLLRISLFEMSDNEQVLLVVQPAICADSRGLAEIVKRLHQLCTGEESAAEPMQYADIADWQYELLEGPEGELGRNFWSGQDHPDSSRVLLPFQRSGLETSGFERSSLEFQLDREVSTELEKLSAQLGTSPENVLLSCYAALIARLSSTPQLVLGVRRDGRNYDDLIGSTGLLARYLPLAIEIAPSTTLRDLVCAVESASSDATDWQSFFAQESNAGQTFFSHCFEAGYEPLVIERGDLSFQIEDSFDCIDRYELRFAVQSRDGLYGGRLDYNALDLQESVMQRLSRQLPALIERAVRHPGTPLLQLDILSDSERHEFLNELNDTAAEYPRGVLFHELFEQQVECAPDRCALSFQGRNVSYRELNTRANQLAHRLRKMGVVPDQLIALCVERSLEAIVGILGILKAGAAYLPLDASYPKERLSFMLEDAKAPIILTLEKLLAEIPQEDSELLLLDRDWPEIATESTENPVRMAQPDNLVYTIYTSGSTGQPKGVSISHEQLVITNAARCDHYRESPDRFLLTSPFAFDSSCVGIFWTLSVGGTLFLIAESEQMELETLGSAIADNAITHMCTLPSFYALMLEHINAGQLKSLRTVIVAGEACPIRLVESHRNLLGETAIFSEYGATETAVWSSLYDCRQQQTATASLGLPIANTQMYLLDTSFGPVPVGVHGEVHFGGENLARGYFNRPGLTAERFVPDPFSGRPGARLYKSGDLACWAENRDLEFLGRIDHQIKIRGFRVELGEIESVLAQYPAVTEAVVVARDKNEGSPQSAGDGGYRLAAYVVPSPGSNCTIGGMRDFLLETLPGYMVPAAFMIMEDFPRTPNGKIDRNALPAPQAQVEEGLVEPRGTTEQVLARIWAELLQVDKVGRDSNFFALGGDSILSIQVVARARAQGVSVNTRDLFRQPTLSALALVAGTSELVAAEQGTVTGEFPLTPIQHWLLDREPVEPEHFNVSMLFEARRPMAADHLETAIAQLFVHHDALRLRVTRAGSVWRQVGAARETTTPFERVDLSAVPENLQQSKIEEYANQQHRNLNLEEGPLARFALFDMGKGCGSRLLIIVHHLVFDGVSWRILLEDIETACENLNTGSTIELPNKTSSFKQWSEQLTELVSSDDLRDDLAYWLSQARHETAIAPLPLDVAGDKANSEASQRMVTISLEAEETRALLQDVPAAYNTQINDALLTAVLQAFADWTGCRSTMLDLEGHGREDLTGNLDLSRSVGWFTSVFPVHLQLAEEDDLGAVLMSVKEQLRAIPNRGVGYGIHRYLSRDPEVVRALRGGYQPLVNFNYLGQFDQVLSTKSLFRMIADSCGPDRSPKGNRSHILEVVAIVVDGCLQIDWNYSENLHDRSTIVQLAQSFKEHLEKLIAHCCSQQVGRYTVSDFSEFDWDQDELDSIVAAVHKSQENP